MIDWDRVDWSRGNRVLARDLGVSTSVVRRHRARHPRARASDCKPGRVLSYADALNIRAARAAGAPLRLLAERYGVSLAIISMTARGLVHRQPENGRAMHAPPLPRLSPLQIQWLTSLWLIADEWPLTDD